MQHGDLLTNGLFFPEVRSLHSLSKGYILSQCFNGLVTLHVFIDRSTLAMGPLKISDSFFFSYEQKCKTTFAISPKQIKCTEAENQ